MLVLSLKAAVEKLDVNNQRTNMNVESVFVYTAPIPTVAHADTIADLAPAHGPIVADLTVGPTVESAGEGAIAAPPCPTAAGTSATA